MQHTILVQSTCCSILLIYHCSMPHQNKALHTIQIAKKNLTGKQKWKQKKYCLKKYRENKKCEGKTVGLLGDSAYIYISS